MTASVRPMKKESKHVIALLVLVLSSMGIGCQINTISRFPDDVQSALRLKDMRRMETDELVLYYSQKQKAAVKRFALKVGRCQKIMQTHLRIRHRHALQKPVLIVPEVPFNNAFVAPGVFGERTVSVVPLAQRIDLFGIPFDSSYVGCHEIVHYVHFLQVSGFWYQFNKFFGNTITPQIGSDAWVFEGLATYYESKLLPGKGRMAWPLWRGFFHAGFAGKTIDGGDFSAFKRPFHGGNHYLVGSHFIEYIANTYGEQALWAVVQSQGSSLGIFFNTASKWQAGTGKKLPQLIREFAQHTRTTLPPKNRPASQKTLKRLSNDAQYARSSNGLIEAIVQGGGDKQTTLEILKDGKTIQQKRLVDIFPPSGLVIARPSVSGLSIRADGKYVYFVTVDLGSIYQESRLIRYDVQKNKLQIMVDDIVGIGGGISEDGAYYYYTEAFEDTWRPAQYNTSTKKRRALYQPAPGTYYSKIRPSPDGTKLAAAAYNDDGYHLAIFDIKTGRPFKTLKVTGALTEPTWIDNQSVLFIGEVYEHFQVHSWNLNSEDVTIKSNAPYGVMNAWAHNDEIRFLNREHWHWTLDSIQSSSVRTDGAHDVPRTDATFAIELQAPADDSLNVVSDKSYSAFDGLLFPSLRAPLYIQPLDGVQLFGLSLFGGDRLSFHRWALSAITDVDFKEIGGHASYTMSVFAPYTFSIHANRLAYRKKDDLPFREHSLLASLTRRRRLSQGSLQFLGLEDKEPLSTIPALTHRRLAGPGLVLAHFRGDRTPYGGLRRGYQLRTNAHYFDKELNTLNKTMWFLGAQLNINVPVPWTQRHGLQWRLDGQMFTNTDLNTPLLEIGASPGAMLWSKNDPLELEESTLLPGSGAFQIPLRGFEDLPFRSDKILTSHFIYSFPIVIDQGFATFLYLLPSFFIRNIDLNIFASAATRKFNALKDDMHSAAGASIAIQSVLGLFPLDFRYQISKRLSDDEAWSQWLSLGQTF